jgi:hypothetical protein
VSRILTETGGRRLDVLLKPALAERLGRPKSTGVRARAARVTKSPHCSAIAVKPIVVARGEHGGRLEHVSGTQWSSHRGVVTRTVRSLLEVAVVHRERQRLAVHVGNQVGDSNRGLDVRVGQVTPEPIA